MYLTDAILYPMCHNSVAIQSIATYLSIPLRVTVHLECFAHVDNAVTHLKSIE